MIEKTCCITGHREISQDKKAYVSTEMRKEILLAIENGYTRFISGFAEGVDLEFATIIAELKEQGHPLILEAAIPYAKRMNNKNKSLQKMLAACDEIKVICERYTPKCFFIRNRYLVEQSSLVISIYDGRESGGTFYTMRYANSKGRTVRVIKL